MTTDLSQRLGRACTFGHATPVERETLIRAATVRTVKTADDMPASARALLLDLEDRAKRSQ